LERSKTDLATAEKDLAGCEVRAPVSGIVMYGNPDQSWRRTEISVGGTVHRGMVIMTIPDMSLLEVVASIHEADVHKVKPGQKARITVDAMSGKVYEGEVTRVAQVASTGGMIPSDVKEFEVKISIEALDGLKPGFSCEAEVVTDNIPSALYLPVASVFRDGDTYFVMLEEGGSLKKQLVETGRSSVQFVEILSGIKDGQKVYLDKDTE
ncbi:MAG: HlyD family efflux transporter periplasmic adaptor subunit, partial [Lentisphaerae bacterium]|nr:HlyD family efflux transporter periplasmic adaptor subunit [Lentisphaerota bacterium]